MMSIDYPDGIDRRERLSREQFEQQYLARSRPVLLTNQINEWPALKTWSLDYLAAAQGDNPVEVEYYPSHQRHDAYTYCEMTLGEYIGRIQDDPAATQTYYLADKLASEVIPELLHEFQTPELIDPSAFGRTVVFLGRDTFSSAHYHRYCRQALLAQVAGEKRIVLYAPRDLRRLSPNPWYSLRPNFSRIPFDHQTPDEIRRRYPRLANGPSWEVTVKPGEMLFIPDHWMHTAEGLGESISVTFFWVDALKYAYLPGVARDVLAATAKKSYVGLARVGVLFGLSDTMITAATALGILRTADKLAVRQYLDEFGTSVPEQRERRQLAAQQSTTTNV